MSRACVFMVLSLFAVASQAGFRQFTIEYKVEGRAVDAWGERVVYHMDGNRFRQDGFSQTKSMIVEHEGDKLITTVIDHEEKIFLRTERPLGADPGVFDLTGKKGASNPCGNNAKLRCERLGKGKLLGYDVVKWRVTHENGQVSEVWYAPALGYHLKMIAPQNGFSMTAVRVVNKRPPAGTFEPPANYRKQDLDALMGGMMGGGMLDAGRGAPEDGSGPTAPAAPSMIEEDVKEIATEVGETARDTAKDEVKEHSKKKVRDAIRGLFGD